VEKALELFDGVSPGSRQGSCQEIQGIFPEEEPLTGPILL